MATNYDVTKTTRAREQDALRLAAYQVGRIAALREVGCECGAVKGHRSDGKRICGCSISTIKCNRCRLLAEAESGEQEREVGGEG